MGKGGQEGRRLHKPDDLRGSRAGQSQRREASQGSRPGFRSRAETHKCTHGGLGAAQEGRHSDSRLVPVSTQRRPGGTTFPSARWPQPLFLRPKHHKEGKSGFFSVQSLFTAKYTEYVVIYVTAKSKGRAVERKGGSASI